VTVTESGLELKSAAGRGTLLAAVLASGMVFLDGTVVNVALPALGAELGASVAGLQWTVNAYALTLAGFVLVGGALGDRDGRRRVFLLGLVWFTVASVLCGAARSVEWLIAARALQGVGAALLVPTSLALLEGSFRRDERARAIGAWSGLTGIAAALGPFVGGWLIDSFSWRWIFFINVPLAVVVLFASLRWVVDSRDETATQHRFDLRGAVLAAAGLGGVSYALVTAGERGWAAPAVIGPGLAGAVLLALFVRDQHRRGSAAMLPTELFAARSFGALNLVTFFIYAGLVGAMFFLVITLQVVGGYSALAAGMSLLPFTVLMALGSERAGAIAARIGPRGPLTVGAALGALGLVLLQRVGPDPAYLADVLPGVLLLALGVTALVAPLTAAVLAAPPERLAGAASGVNNAVARTAGLLAVAALPMVVGLTGSAYADPVALLRSYRGAIWWCAALLVAGAVTAWLSLRPPASPVDGAGDRSQ
jgi:EmrB/QacA subfamily drug resistance transporter